MGESPPLTLRISKAPLRGKETEMAVPEQTLENIPKASAEGLRFVQSLDYQDYKEIEFCERLTTFSDNGKEIGTFSVAVKASSNGFGDGFLVKASSVGKVDGMLCGTKVTSLISRNMLETVEHRQRNFLFLKEESLQRETDIIKQPNGYLINVTASRGQDVKKTTRFVKHEHTAGLISEGADLILQRLLVRKGVPENFQLISLDSNGHIGAAKYERLKENFDDDVLAMGILGISRTITSWREKPLTWHTHLTSNGHLAYRHQIGSSFSMKLSPSDLRKSIEEVTSLPKSCDSENTTITSCDSEKTAIKSCDSEKITIKSCDSEKIMIKSCDSEKTTIKSCDSEKIMIKSCDSEKTTIKSCDSEKIMIKSCASDYTNGKTKSTLDSQTYVKQHPELNTITTDFLQLLFIQKPSNVPLFAANYFSALASETEASDATAVGTT